MTKSNNTQNRLDALRAVGLAQRAVGDLSRQSVQQDKQIDDLIDRLVAAAETIKNEQAEARGARKVAAYFHKQNMELNTVVDVLLDMLAGAEAKLCERLGDRP